MLTRLLCVVLLVLCVAGCSATQLKSQAEKHDAIGQTADTAANRLQSGLDTGSALRDLVATPEFRAALVMFPSLADAVDQANATGDDIRPVLEQAIADLRATAQANREQAQVLRSTADDAALSDVQRFGAAATSVVSGINPLIGTVLGAVVGAVGVWRKAVSTGITRGASAVSGVINVGRSVDRQFNDKFSGAAGAAMAAQLSMTDPRVRKAVQNTKIGGG